MKNKIICFFALLIILTSCDKELHEIPTDKPSEEAVVTMSLNTEHIQSSPLNDVHLYWFSETDKLYKQDYYSSMEELARARITIPEGNYTIVAVLNVGADFALPSSRAIVTGIDLNEFSKYIREQEVNYANMLTGTLRKMVKNGVQLFYIGLEPKSSGIEDSSVELRLTIPSPYLPNFASTKATVNPSLRATAFIFKKGSKELFAVKRAMLTPVDATNGIYSMGLSLFKGEYDVNLWCDYTFNESTDNHYITTDPDIISIQPKEKYTANTDTRDGLSRRISLTVAEGIKTPQNIEMYRPLAKYRLVATDIAKYEAKRVQKGLPELKDLRVFIGYEGFLPTAYSITESKLTDAQEGYFYYSTLSDIGKAKADIAKDYILVSGEQSSITATILFKDAEGKTVSGISGVKIAYRPGQLTTVSGDFLTANPISGVTIDTDWSGDYDVDF